MNVELQKRLAQWSAKEIRFGQLWPVSVALTLIIATIFALTALAERIEQVVVKQGKQALTADTVFVTSNPLPEQLLSLANDNDLSTAQETRFATMAFSDSEMQLITVRAVESAYPLQGELILTGGEGVANHVQPGELWIDERILYQLGVEIGDEVSVGDADLVVSGLITEEPGLSFNPFQQMPSAFIHSSDLERTGAVQTGSRVRYSLYINGTDAVIEKLKEGIELTPSDRWRDENSQSRTNEVFKRTQQYLSLSVVIVVLMAATTLVLTCQHYVNSRSKIVAMLKSLGASKVWIRRWLWTQVSLLFVIGSIAGVLIGMGLEFLLRVPLTDLLPSPLPSYGVTPFVMAIVSCGLIAIPSLGIPLTRLLNINAAAVMQSSIDQKVSAKRWWLVLIPVVPFLAAFASNIMVWIVLVSIAVLFIVLSAVSVLIIRWCRRLPLGTAFALAISD